MASRRTRPRNSQRTTRASLPAHRLSLIINDLAFEHFLNFTAQLSQVVEPDSQHVVDAIATTATGPGDRPTEPVVIESITIS